MNVVISYRIRSCEHGRTKQIDGEISSNEFDTLYFMGNMMNVIRQNGGGG
jgi:hypothetical protein